MGEGPEGDVLGRPVADAGNGQQAADAGFRLEPGFQEVGICATGPGKGDDGAGPLAVDAECRDPLRCLLGDQCGWGESPVQFGEGCGHGGAEAIDKHPQPAECGGHADLLTGNGPHRGLEAVETAGQAQARSPVGRIAEGGLNVGGALVEVEKVADPVAEHGEGGQ